MAQPLDKPPVSAYRSCGAPALTRSVFKQTWFHRGWLKRPLNGAQFKATAGQVPEWFGRLTLKEKDALKVMIDARGQSLNTLEKARSVIPARNDFALSAVVDASTDKRRLQRARRSGVCAPLHAFV